MMDRYAGRVLRTKASRSSSLRLLNDRDRDDVLELCDRDPVVNVFVSSRVMKQASIRSGSAGRCGVLSRAAG